MHGAATLVIVNQIEQEGGLSFLVLMLVIVQGDNGN